MIYERPTLSTHHMSTKHQCRTNFSLQIKTSSYSIIIITTNGKELNKTTSPDCKKSSIL
uniref:Uncharacterized protein n=1 Tax=Anguilla anguilla TaxID=7936 RepID=A0A0E9TPG2_ANGAN